MLLQILIIVAMLGAPALAIFSVFRRIKNNNPNIAGYVYNGKNWVAWLLVFSIIATLFIGFIMPIFDGREGYHPEWGTLWLILLAVILYICYAIIAFIPASAEEIEESKKAGNTVLGSIGESAVSIFSIIMGVIGATLMALPAMIGEALNPTLAIKNIGGTLYRVVGTGFGYTISGIIALAFIAIIVFVIIYIAALVFAIIGTFAIGLIAIIKFVKNNGSLLKKE
ncbi:MAG: hypothetical protein J6T37_07665 [Bacteroidales bacterium]|jgi:hypothetical protein|nr:hypothetical protein [Bacteroidales bacterium]MBO7529737.1 hypothetical protein [Bacteroidales bacterium]MBQ3845286.1 hypothetical protein [Bacteroidales bacterium]